MDHFRLPVLIVLRFTTKDRKGLGRGMLFNDVDAQLSASDPEEDSDSSEKHVVVSISSTTRGSGRVISLEDPATDQPAPVETGIPSRLELARASLSQASSPSQQLDDWQPPIV